MKTRPWPRSATRCGSRRWRACRRPKAASTYRAAHCRRPTAPSSGNCCNWAPGARCGNGSSTITRRRRPPSWSGCVNQHVIFTRIDDSIVDADVDAIKARREIGRRDAPAHTVGALLARDHAVTDGHLVDADVVQPCRAPARASPSQKTIYIVYIIIRETPSRKIFYRSCKDAGPSATELCIRAPAGVFSFAHNHSHIQEQHMKHISSRTIRHSVTGL